MYLCSKIASNSTTNQCMEGDKNFYAGVILDPHQPMDSIADELLAQVIQVVSEAPTKSERNTFREAEFVAWHAGVRL